MVRFVCDLEVFCASDGHVLAVGDFAMFLVCACTCGVVCGTSSDIKFLLYA